MIHGESDFLRERGTTALGSRLRRLFEQLNGPVTQFYREHADFEQRWFALGSLLADSGPLDAGTAAARLGHSAVAVTQVSAAMEKAGLLERAVDATDSRRRVLRLTRTGKQRMRRVATLAAIVDHAARDLLAEAAPHLMQQLDALDDALRREGYATRIHRAANAVRPSRTRSRGSR